MKKRLLFVFLIVCMILELFAVLNVFAENGSINATINSSSRKVKISGTASENAMLIVYYPGCEEVALSKSNLAGNIVYTTLVNGSYNENFYLPKDAPEGVYVVKETGKEIKNSQFIYKSVGLKETFFEDFSDTALWETSQMCVSNGVLVSTSLSPATAYIKSEENAFAADAQYTFEYTADFGDRDDWLTFVFRKTNEDAERLLIRKNSIRIYNPGSSSNMETSLIAYEFEDGKKYCITVDAVGMDICVTIKDIDGNILSTASYSTDCISAGGVGFETFRMSPEVESIAISEYIGEEIYFENKICGIPVGGSYEAKVLNNNSSMVTYTSSDSTVATVDSSTGVVTGISNGVATITATVGDDSSTCGVTVYTQAEDLVASEKGVTLELGDMMSVSVSSSTKNANLSGLVWQSEKKSVSLFGISPTSKTIIADALGSSVICISDSITGNEINIPVKVVPKESEGMISASFSADGIKNQMKKSVFGVAGNLTYADIRKNLAKDLIDELNIGMLRSFGTTEAYSTSTFEIANEFDLPHMIAIPFYNQTVEEIVEDVEQIVSSLDNNECIYIEFGNELYDGTKGISVEEYVTKCRAAYAAVKSLYPEAKIGVPVWSERIGKTYEWNTTLFAAQDCYDAIILHNYKTLNSIDGRTQSEMMLNLYSSTQQFGDVIKKANELAPNKEIWISEYGFLIMALFNQQYDFEKDRMQFAKSTGAALVNMEQTMDMLSDGITDVAAYHFLNDAQGFGIIQDETKLPNYYVFKEVAHLLEMSTYSYGMSPLYSSIIGYSGDTWTTQDTPVYSVDAWGFGDENTQKYVVFSNRTENPATVDVAGYRLKKVWEYGGEDDILGEYLTNTVTFAQIPPTITTPVTYNDEDYKDVVSLDKYSIVVCEVQENNSDTFSINIETNPSKWDFNKTGGLKLMVGNDICDVTLYEGEHPISVHYAEVSDGVYKITKDNGWEYNKSYKLVVESENTQRTYEFTTIDAPEYVGYVENYKAADEYFGTSWEKSLTAWSILDGTIKKTTTDHSSATLNTTEYTNALIDYTIEFVDTDNYTGHHYNEITLRDGFIRIWDNGVVFSYFNGENDKYIGRINMPDTNKIDLRFTMHSDTIEVYWKEPGEKYYSFVGKVEHVNNISNKIKFSGPGKYTITNFVVAIENSIVDNIGLFKVDDGKTEISSIVDGTNSISVTVNENVQEYVVLLALMNDERLIETQIGVADGKTQEFTFEVTGKTIDTAKIFIWENLDTYRPLSRVYSFTRY